MQFKYFDIHSHINLSPLRENIEAVLARMQEKGVGTITIGVDLETSKDSVSFAEKYDNLWAGVGLHPADNVSEVFDYDAYLELAKHPRVVCIGECGLDYFRDQKEETKQRQKEIFRKHIELAIAVGKPLMIHARPSKGSMNAYEDALEILSPLKGQLSHGNFDFFVGNLEIAKKIVARGWTVSFDGPITFARDYDEVIRGIPLENIMAETDAPFAAPEPYRGQTCEPWMVEEVYKKIAEIRGGDAEEVRKTILATSEKIFSIRPKM